MMPDPVSAQKMADLPGVRIRYFDTGGPGAAVVFLHAATGNAESWLPQLEVFSKAGYRAIAYDRRGWGMSNADPATGPQPGSGAEDLGALMEYLKVDRFHLVGLAAGAQVAIDYSAWRGDRLLSMVLAASLGPGGNEPELAAFSARIAIPGVTDPQYREVGASFRGADPEGFQRWKEIATRAQQKGAPSQQMRSPNTYAKMETIRVRTLVMPGDSDLLSPPAMMKLWAVHIKDAQWVLVPDAGHSINTEQPRFFSENVLRFLSGQRFPAVPVSGTVAY